MDQLERALLKFAPGAGGLIAGLIGSGLLRDTASPFVGFIVGGAVGGLITFFIIKAAFMVLNPKRGGKTKRR